MGHDVYTCYSMYILYDFYMELEHQAEYPTSRQQYQLRWEEEARLTYRPTSCGSSPRDGRGDGLELIGTSWE